jgi:hypothetical protein
LDPGTRSAPEHLMVWSGEWVRRLEPGATSSEAELTPERASGPRARRSLHPRERQALERGGVSPEGASGPRARRSLRDVASGPRARRKLARGVPRPVGWWAVVASLGRGPFHFWAATTRNMLLGFVACSFCVLLFFEKGVFPGN